LGNETAAITVSYAERVTALYRKMMNHPAYRPVLLLTGAPANAVAYAVHRYRKSASGYDRAIEEIRSRLLQSGRRDELLKETREQLRRKREFFGYGSGEQELEREAERIVSWKFQEEVKASWERRPPSDRNTSGALADTFGRLVENRAFLSLSLIFAFPMYLLMLVYANPYLKYIAERLVMALFVILGVAVLVFTILYLSPTNPAANLLGDTATNEQIASFNRLYGLDQPYLVQLWDTLRGIFTFDLGKSFAGNESVTTAISNKFPVTLTLTAISTLVAVLIALPIGIISATRPNSFFDYSFMFIALLGLSIPNFWQGLIFILNFSIQLPWLPATYNPHNWLSAIMPIVVLGTGLTAAVARMTRSSTLEVIHEDYITTARAKGLSRRRVIWRHAVGNALIPIVTVIGLQFGSMLGGAAVTEKVFNINGIGSYIVDKQFIPDIPSVMGGVVYTAITISIVNVIVDLLYAFFDPRIRTKMKQY